MIATQEKLAIDMLSSEAVEHRVQTLRDHLAEGSERAQDVLRQLFPTAIRLEPGCQRAGPVDVLPQWMDKALYDQDLTALFPQVENNGSGGRI